MIAVTGGSKGSGHTNQHYPAAFEQAVGRELGWSAVARLEQIAGPVAADCRFDRRIDSPRSETVARPARVVDVVCLSRLTCD